jgi:hypothetical protein
MWELIYGSTYSCPRNYLEVSGQIHAPAAPFAVTTGCVCLDDMETRHILTLPGLEFRPLDRPARSADVVPTPA